MALKNIFKKHKLSLETDKGPDDIFLVCTVVAIRNCHIVIPIQVLFSVYLKRGNRVVT